MMGQVTQSNRKSMPLSLHRSTWLWLLLPLLVACSGAGESDDIPPRVLTVVPSDGDAGVTLGSAVTVTFSEPVRSDSVTADSFRVERGGVAVPGTRSVQGEVVRFTADGGFATGSTYSVTLTSGIRDLAGNSLASGRQWSFITASLGRVELQWAPSHARGVNDTGGGYRVYYSNTPGFAIATASSKDVAWPGFGQTPTQLSLPLTAGNWYFKVVAYSAVGGGSQSPPSAEIMISIR